MAHPIHTTQTSTGETVQYRVRNTTVEGLRGWVWETSEGGEWSEPNGPMPSRAEAQEWAKDTIASW